MIPEEIIARTSAQPKWERKEETMDCILYLVVTPGLDLSMLSVTEKLGKQRDITDEQVAEAKARLTEVVKKAAWEYLKGIVEKGTTGPTS